MGEGGSKWRKRWQFLCVQPNLHLYDKRVCLLQDMTMKLRRHILNIRTGGAGMSGNDVVRFPEVIVIAGPYGSGCKSRRIKGTHDSGQKRFYIETVLSFSPTNFLQYAM